VADDGAWLGTCPLAFNGREGALLMAIDVCCCHVETRWVVVPGLGNQNADVFIGWESSAVSAKHAPLANSSAREMIAFLEPASLDDNVGVEKSVLILIYVHIKQ
jgi:hypothetical protein